MRIKNLITGIESTERSDIARALIRQGLCAQVGPDESTGTVTGFEDSLHIPKTAAVTPVPIWTVVLRRCATSELAELSIRLDVGKATYFYSGDPKFTNAKRTWDGGECYINFGREVPAVIADEYKKQWKANERHRGPYDNGVRAAQPDTSARDLILANAREAAKIHFSAKELKEKLDAFNESVGK